LQVGMSQYNSLNIHFCVIRQVNKEDSKISVFLLYFLFHTRFIKEFLSGSSGVRFNEFCSIFLT